MKFKTIEIPTRGERFYNITGQVQVALTELLGQLHGSSRSGMLFLVNLHTSCGLTINEAFEDSASSDMESFLKHVASREMKFITHTTEGADDSPSHMKSMLLQQSLAFIVDNNELIMGQWQGIYLAEFRDSPKSRKVLLKFIPDS
ncbi:MAG: YjbQ family protein [Bacteriovoracaceae bacterium]|nr:YjbQ family protein [Bacteriovoracaceae bacterium]